MRDAPLGATPATPLIIGDVNGELKRVRVIRSVEGLAVASLKWVSGSGVQEHLDNGDFVDTTRVAQRARSWRVGEHIYWVHAEAIAAGAALGLSVIEVA